MMISFVAALEGGVLADADAIAADQRASLERLAELLAGEPAAAVAL